MTISARTRQIIYVVTAIGTPIVAWLNLRGWIGDDVVGLWSAEVAVVGGLAALKTGDTAPPVAAEDVQAGDVVEVIPASEATSDTKADAVGESTSRRALKAKQTDDWEG